MHYVFGLLQATSNHRLISGTWLPGLIVWLSNYHPFVWSSTKLGNSPTVRTHYTLWSHNQRQAENCPILLSLFVNHSCFSFPGTLLLQISSLWTNHCTTTSPSEQNPPLPKFSPLMQQCIFCLKSHKKIYNILKKNSHNLTTQNILVQRYINFLVQRISGAITSHRSTRIQMKDYNVVKFCHVLCSFESSSNLWQRIGL